jgi:pyruvate dehydrogenase E1 component beta subunit
MAEITYREALNNALREEMQRDDRVFLLGEDIGVFQGSYKVTANLLQEFGAERVKDTPIAEEAIVALGIGAAMVGLRPVVELMTINFSLLAIDQIVNHAAKMHYMFGGQVKVPLVIRMPGGGGFQLGAQHSQTLDVMYAYVPGLIVIAPATPADAKGMLKAAIRDENPVIFIESEGLYNTKGEVPEGEHLVTFGTADVKRPGKDITLITYSKMLLISMQAAEELAKQGIEVEVIDLRSLRPLDITTVVESVKNTSRAVVVEEGWKSYGIGAELSARIMEEAFDYLDAPVTRIAGAEVPAPYSKALEDLTIPHAQQIVEAIRKAVE